MTVLRLLAVSLVIAGGTAFAWGFRIPAKAAMAQWLMAQSWSTARATGTPTAPWPWADFRVVGRLEAVDAGRTVFVLSQADDRSLAFGPGIVTRSLSTTVIAGHQDTHFRFLEDLGPNSELFFTDADGRRTAYRVSAQRVLKGDRFTPLTGPEPQLILATCWPGSGRPGHRPDRYLVFAEARPD